MRRLLPFLLLGLIGLVAWVLLSSSGEDAPGPDDSASLAPVEATSPASAPGTATDTGRRETASAAPVGFEPRRVKVGFGSHRLNGVVIDERGEPVPGAWIAAYSVPIPFIDFEMNIEEIFTKPLDLSLEPLTSTVADDEGRFALEGTPGRDLYVVARSFQRLTPRRQRVPPSALDSEEGVVIRTVAAADMKGRVVDSEGRPVAGAEVLVGPGIKFLIAAFRTRNFFFERTFTDANGEFSLDAVPANQPLTANAFYGPTRSGLNEAGPYAARVTGAVRIELERMGGLSGVVVDLEGEGINNASVIAVPLDLRRVIPFVRNPVGWSVTSRQNGNYRFDELPRGTYLLMAQGRDGRSAPINGAVTSDESIAPPINIDTKAMVAGRVVNGSGEPVAGAVVHLKSIPLADGGESQRGNDAQMLLQAARELLPELLPESTFVRTDGRGKFKIPAWHNARLRVETSDYGTHDFDLRSTSAEKPPVLVVYTPGSIEGVVVDGAARKPVNFYLVRGDHRGLGRNTEKAEELAGDSLPFPEIGEDETLVFPASSWRAELKASQLVDSKDGKFKLTGIPPGKWELNIKATDYADTEVEDIFVFDGQTTSGVIVNLDRGATIEGRVVEADGDRPVGGAFVAVGRGEESSFEAMLQGLNDDVAIGETNADGSFVIYGARERADHVNVMADGYAMESLKIEPLEAFEVREDVVVKLGSGGTVQGTVTDRNGTVLAGRMVAVMSIQARDFMQTTTNAEGLYRIEHIRPGSYFVLSAALDDESLFQGDFAAMIGSSRFLTAWIAADQVTTVDIVDDSAGGCRLEGVIQRRGKPIAGAGLTAVSMDGTGMMDFRFSTTRSDADGKFVFKSLAPGDYRMNVDSEDWDGEIELVVADLPEDYIILEVPRNMVRGRVVAGLSGEPVKDANVQLVRDDGATGMGMMMFGGGGRSRSWSRTKEDGAFEFEGITPGEYHLEVSAGNNWNRSDDDEEGIPLGRHTGEKFTISKDQEIDIPAIQLPIAGQIRVLAQDSSGKKFEGRFSARLTPLEGQQINAEDWSMRGWGRNGEARIRGLESGRYKVTVTADDYAPTVVEEVSVREGETTDINVTLSQGVALRARILDANNQPVSAQVKLLNRDGIQVNETSQFSAMRSFFEASADGAIDVGTYAPGSYTLVATYEGDERTMPVTLIEGQPTVVELRF